MLSYIADCKRKVNESFVEHWQGLTWYFEECAKNKGKPPADVKSYLPWNLSQTDLEKPSLKQSCSMGTGPPS